MQQTKSSLRPPAKVTQREIEAFCSRGHRLPKVTVQVGDEETVSCPKCQDKVTFAVTRDDDNHLKVEARKAS